ncbi:IMPACT family protein [Azospirillum endophyticum]
MFTLVRTERFEQEIKKSRFLAQAAPADSEEEARRFIAASSIPDAGHNCWALRVGDVYRFSDDGEPGGTAGRPILQAIEGRDLDRVAVVVSRWFGGILLGAGGLVRAYGGTAASCLKAAEREPIVAYAILSIACAFADEARIRSGLSAFSGTRAETAGFTPDGVQLQVTLPRDRADEFIRLVADISRGQAMVERVGDRT